MKCPFCSSIAHRVVDKRAVNCTGEVRRRRECLKCSKRFTTYEKIADIELWVIKRDGRREPFYSDKLKNGIVKALEKRPDFGKAGEIADKVEQNLKNKGLKEVPSKLIGRIVLAELKKVDAVAYLRFVSVYRQFQQPEDFMKELEHLT